MQIEKKQLSDTESILFFTHPLSMVGTSIATKNIPASLEILKNIFDTEIANTVLLTSDFIYIKSNTAENLLDLEMLSLAEIDDVTNQKIQLIASANNTHEKVEIIL